MALKKLYRSQTDKMIAGACGGLAEYFEIDSTLLRLVWALIVVFTGFAPGVVVYIVAALIMPLRPVTDAPRTPSTPGGTEAEPVATDVTNHE